MTGAPLTSLFYANKGNISDKWEQYLAVYEAELAPWHGLPVDLLEIGVQNGGSMQVWSRYFDAASHLVGIDIDERIASLEHAKNVELFVADGTEPDQLFGAVGERTFDIIIDDGSHFSSDIANSFRLLFPRLRPGGRYFVEDLHCSYWERFGGGLQRPDSAIEFLKQLIDVLHLDHLEGDADFDGDITDDLLLDLRKGLGRVTFYDSVAVIERLPFTKVEPFRRVLAGDDGALVDPLELMRHEAPARLLFAEPLARKIETSVLGRIEEFNAIQAANDQLTFENDSLAEEIAAHRTNAIAVDADRQSLDERLREAERDLVEHRSLARKSDERSLSASADAMRAVSEAMQAAARVRLTAETAAVAAQSNLDSAVGRAHNLQAQMEVVTARADDYGRAVVSLRNQVSAIERSLTYRLVAPARGAARFARRARRGLTNLTSRGEKETNGSGSMGDGQPPHRPSTEQTIGKHIDPISASYARAHKYARWREQFSSLSGSDRHLIARHIATGTLPAVVVLIRVDTVDCAQISASLDAVSNQWFPEWSAWLTITPTVRTDAVMNTVADHLRRDQRFRLVEGDTNSTGLDGAVVVVTSTNATLNPQSLYLLSESTARGAVLAYGDSEVLDPLTDQVLPSLKPSYSPIYQALHGYIGSTFSIDNRQSQFTAGLHAFAAHQTAASTLVDAAAASHALGTPGGPERIPFLTQRDHALQTSGREQPDEATGPRSAVTVSIIIPTRDRRELLEPCITSLLADTNYPRELLEIIVVDNGSTEPGTLEYLRRLRRDGLVVIRDDGDFNYPRLNNRAAGIATGEVLVLLNNDTTVFDADWLHIMVSYAMRPGVGAVGAKLLYPDLSVQHGGVVLGIQGVAAHVNHMLPFDDESYETIADRTHEVAAVTGACLAIRRAVYGEIGQLDESLAVTFNDIDLCCAALTHGYRNVYVGSALIIHHESKSRGYDIKPEQQEAFRIEAIRARSKHPDLYGDDPYYNPNFSLERTYDFAEPPRAIRPWILARRNAEESRCILMLSSTHQIGHGVAVVVDIQARHLASLGHRVIVGGPVSQSDFAYKDCERVDLRNEIEAAQFAFECGADVVVMHTPPFFGTARWLGAEQIKIAYDYGEPDPDLFSDAQSRRNVLADKRFSMALADRRYAISESVRAESSFTDMGVIPLGNAHLATWGPEHESVRAAIRARHGWTNKLVVFNVCRFHGAERNYKGVDAYSTLLHVLKSFTPGLANDVVFVLCGKGDTRDVREMEAKGLTVFANVTDAEMTELYAAADLYINLSLWEGYNLGIGQALAMGLPTLASDIPAHRAFEIKTTNDVVEQVAWLQMQSDGLVAGSSPRRVPRVWGWEPSLRQLAAIIAAS